MLKHSDYTVSCDALKHYSMFSVTDSQGKPLERTRVDHSRGAIRALHSQLPNGTPVALETDGNGHIPAISGLVLPALGGRHGWIVAEIACLEGQAWEAANVIVRHRHAANWRDKYISRLFERMRRRKGHAVAVGTIGRYLAEATYRVLTRTSPTASPLSRRVGSHRSRSSRAGPCRAWVPGYPRALGAQDGY